MANNGKKNVLLVVESPAKARTIERYLGKGYSVVASMGHLIDLPKSRLAIDTENGFEPEYITVRGKAPILRELRLRAAKASMVLLASDNDREGEAISYHIRNAILTKNPDLPIRRIVFNEITPQAIRQAVSQPSEIDAAKVDAQKARRVLDRLVGYNLSPLLWRKVKNGLSAGRVQSVALRLICEREKEVEAFVPEEYWTLEVQLRAGRSKFRAALAEIDGTKPELRAEPQVRAILDQLAGGIFSVAGVRSSEKTIGPRPPFTTSTLQQTAANRLGFTSRKTMQIAQQLYEGVDIGAGRTGLITYMRTDSTRVSTDALNEVREFIGESYPDALPPEAITYALGKNVQDAHEAIRPSYVRYRPEEVEKALTRDQLRLYSIIWERFVSSQMEVERQQTTTVDIRNGVAVFRATETKTISKGFQAVLRVLKTTEKRQKLPILKEGQEVELLEYHPEQHFTTGPARFTDASVVKTLEEKGIGRPSTYAPIISVLLDRYYVVRSSRTLVPTTLGRIINDILSVSFPDVVDVGFTASMERRLDEVEEHKAVWADVIREFYGPFKARVDHVFETLESIKGVLDEATDYVCERCGRPLVKKLGKFGFFLACSGFPDCRFTRPVPLAACPRPDCGGDVVERKRRGKGRSFYGCTNYPECDFVTYDRPTGESCPKCGQMVVERDHRARNTCVNPECDYSSGSDDAQRDGTENGEQVERQPAEGVQQRA